MNRPHPDLEERVEAYLDGALSREETRAFERELAERPDAAGALSSALALRDLLRELPPLHPPLGLEERIAAALPLRKVRRERREREALPRTRAALAGASWGLRGPAAALGGTLGGAGPMTGGFSQVRWILGPLALPRAERSRSARVPLWKRALGFGGQRA